jgi:hypothetical protein
VTATRNPAAAAARTQRPGGFWAGVRAMCLPLALFVMALPSLTGQTTSAPHLRTRAESEPLITWDNLWMVPVGWIALNIIFVLLMVWRGYGRKR